MHDKENELELERELHELPIIYQWEAIRCDRASYALRWMIAIGSSLIVYGGLYLLIKDSETIIPLLLMGIAMALVSRYLFLADEHICFYLTKKGIHFTTEQIIPEMAYKVMRAFAWFGVAVSFFAVTIIGSMAFIGAGACALLSFKMTGFESKISKSYILFSDEYTLFDIRKEDTFAIISHPYDLYASYEWLFYFPKDREEIKNHLLKVFRKSRYIEINHPKEIDNYGPFESSENLSINNANS